MPDVKPTQAELDATLAYELTCAQIFAIRTLTAISQDTTNPKEARAAATAILKFKLPTPPTPAEAPELPTPTPAATTPDADAALDDAIAAQPTSKPTAPQPTTTANGPTTDGHPTPSNNHTKQHRDTPRTPSTPAPTNAKPTP